MKSPERQLQSQIDVAQNAYLWSAATALANLDNGYWFYYYVNHAKRYHTAWLTLLEVQRDA